MQKGFYTVMALAADMAEAELPDKAIKFLSILLIIGGAAVCGWNMFDSKFIPIYAITAVMVAFGALGLLLLRHRE
jgi:UPF0716 family protein affecting phage T7 exclusion